MFEQIYLILKKDPSIHSFWEVFFTTGFWAVMYYRVTHFLYLHKFYLLSSMIAFHAKRKTGVEIHPGASIGKRFFIDHGMGTVIGETAIIGNDVSIYHGVTLGAKAFEKKKRHPTIGNHVLIGSHATILGDIHIGDYSKIGANTVVLNDVPPYSTVVGLKGRILE